MYQVPVTVEFESQAYISTENETVANERLYMR